MNIEVNCSNMWNGTILELFPTRTHEYFAILTKVINKMSYFPFIYAVLIDNRQANFPPLYTYKTKLSIWDDIWALIGHSIENMKTLVVIKEFMLLWLNIAWKVTFKSLKVKSNDIYQI